MKSLRYVYASISNQGRQKKKLCEKRHRKGVHQLYLKKRLTMEWRIKQFSQKQGYEIFNLAKSNKNIEIHPYVKQKYNEYEAELIKYWGGGKYFKKMGRMDKVRYKQNKKQEQKQDNEENIFQIFHSLEVQTIKENIFSAFKAIQNVKKPRRNIDYSQD